MKLIKLNPADVVVRQGFNPRGEDSFDVTDPDMKALMCSISSNGFWSHKPITVKLVDKRHVIIDGHRRLFASRQLKLKEIFAVIETTEMDETQELITALMSNEGKRLTPIEEARAYLRLTNSGLSARSIALKVGRSNAHVSNRLKLLSAAPEVCRAVEQKLITVQQLQNLLKKYPEDFDKQTEVLVGLIEAKAQRMREGVEKRRESSEESEEQSQTTEGGSDNEGSEHSGGEDKPVKKKKQVYSESVLKELLDLYVEDYGKCTKKDEESKYFYAGGIRALCTILDVEDPVELPL